MNVTDERWHWRIKRVQAMQKGGGAHALSFSSSGREGLKTGGFSAPGKWIFERSQVLAERLIRMML